MLGFVLDLIVTLLAARAVWRLLRGVIEGLSGQPPQARRAGPPVHGVQMARDPVCGTYVVPDHAVALTSGPQQVYFCSTACRDKYRAKSA